MSERKNKGGRPSKYSPELIETICERLASGEPLAQICRDDGMPHPSTVRDWMKEREDVSRSIARAREDGFDAIAVDALRIADFGENDTGEGGDVNHDVIQRSKLRVETRLKLLAKWDPKRYGERIQHANDPEQPFNTVSDAQIEARIRQLLGESE
ncbi:hypothetical protein LY625_03795 [Lysobacter sp. GX 14042]|uniref:terminase small subunit-like protein n=1 Tax=Lysobacter sp. GX 14042 TaxID=2907155 RepID=UPI001F2275D3|nr:hypothetical protein [Lysobacter sp. GX 14042]MCE7031747.1 hypothetical protein [Lysobacter sp. GX 14042]